MSEYEFKFAKWQTVENPVYKSNDDVEESIKLAASAANGKVRSQNTPSGQRLMKVRLLTPAAESLFKTGLAAEVWSLGRKIRGCPLP
jgi:hypothetical protein